MLETELLREIGLSVLTGGMPEHAWISALKGIIVLLLIWACDFEGDNFLTLFCLLLLF
jgi:hypothetical protein